MLDTCPFCGASIQRPLADDRSIVPCQVCGFNRGIEFTHSLRLVIPQVIGMIVMLPLVGIFVTALMSIADGRHTDIGYGMPWSLLALMALVLFLVGSAVHRENARYDTLRENAQRERRRMEREASVNQPRAVPFQTLP